MKKTLENYLLDRDERGDEPTGRFVRSYSSPELEMQAEALKMCLDILDGVPEPDDSTALIKWRMVRNELRGAYAEINMCDKEEKLAQEWKPAPAPRRSKTTDREFPAFRKREK